MPTETLRAGIINEAKDLYDRLIIKAQKMDSDNATIVRKKEELDNLIKGNKELKDELEKRSKAVSEIEDAVALKGQVAKDITNLNNAKKSFNKEQAKVEEENKKAVEEISNDKAANQGRSDKLTKAELALSKDKETYKQKVMLEINDNIEKQKVKI